MVETNIPETERAVLVAYLTQGNERIRGEQTYGWLFGSGIGSGKSRPTYYVIGKIDRKLGAIYRDQLQRLFTDTFWVFDVHVFQSLVVPREIMEGSKLVGELTLDLVARIREVLDPAELRFISDTTQW